MFNFDQAEQAILALFREFLPEKQAVTKYQGITAAQQQAHNNVIDITAQNMRALWGSDGFDQALSEISEIISEDMKELWLTS